MEIWRLAPDTPRVPRNPSAGERVRLEVGSWPLEAMVAEQYKILRNVVPLHRRPIPEPPEPVTPFCSGRAS